MSKFLTPPVWYDKNGNLNDMLTGEASGDGVAVGSTAIASNMGVAVGPTASASNMGAAIGYNVDASGGGVAIGGYARADVEGVAVGNTADASSGGIAIGSYAQAVSSNIIQLGDSGKTFMLNVGDGQGILNIGSIAFQKMTIFRKEVSIGSRGVYLCCTTSGPKVSPVSSVAIFFINDINNTASVLTSSDGSCSYDHSTHVIKPGTNFTIEYCFKIVSL